jgi:tRNA A37 methylthiotransferase MiaB
MPSFIFINKSCYRRQEEIARVRRFLFINGFVEDTDMSRTDLIFLFTCAFCESKVVDMLNELAHIRSMTKEGCEIVVGSCLPDMNSAKLGRVFDGKTITPKDFSMLNQIPGITVNFEAVNSIEDEGLRFPTANGVLSSVRMPDLPGGTSFYGADFDKRMGVFIASGCLRKCSFCAIRFATGPLRSKPLDEVIRTFSEGLNRGYRRFEIYADSIGDYGLDIGTNIGDLFDWLLNEDREFSAGIYDLHPQTFLKYFDKVISLCEAGKVHYLYVPLQSGSSRILRLMNRGCNVDDLLDKLLAVKAKGGLFFQTGIIVGFPTETDKDYEQTLRLLSEVQFTDVYVHCYSDMPDTESSKLSGKVDKQTMLKRLDLLHSAGIRHNREDTLKEWRNVPLCAIDPDGV